MQGKGQDRLDRLAALGVQSEVATPPGEPKMSAVILELAAPLLQQHGKTPERARAIISLAVAGWNKAMFPPEQQWAVEADLIDCFVPKDGSAEAVGVAVHLMDFVADRRAQLYPGLRKIIVDFDVVIATPDAMRVVGKLGQVLGPRGLMPNPKVGTVTTDVDTAVRNAKAGQVRYRTDKAGIVHSTIGKVDFEVDALKGNLTALLRDLVKLKPASAKGTYLQKISVSTTMGPGIVVDQATLDL